MEIHGEDLVVEGSMSFDALKMMHRCVMEAWPACFIELQLDDEPSALLTSMNRHWESILSHWKSDDQDPLEMFVFKDMSSCKAWNAFGRTNEHSSHMIYCAFYETYAAFTAEGDAVRVVKECIGRLKDKPNLG